MQDSLIEQVEEAAKAQGAPNKVSLPMESVVESGLIWSGGGLVDQEIGRIPGLYSWGDGECGVMSPNTAKYIAAAIEARKP